MYLNTMLLKHFRKQRKGATAIEYAIIASLLSVAIIFGVEATGVATQNQYEYVGNELERAFQPASGPSDNLRPSPDR